MAEDHQGVLGDFPTGNLCNASAEVRALDSAIVALSPGVRIAGPARTARVKPGYNAAIHRAVYAAKAGDVLVVDAGGSRAYGPFGDILAGACQRRRIVGLVIDGMIRDSAEVRALGFAVFCRGTNPSATSKSEPGEIDVEVTCGGVRVRPGDWVVGDDDGVVIVPREIAAEVAERANEVAEREREIQRSLSAGQTTLEIFDIEP